MSQSEISPSMEDYLETIYNLVQENKVARTRDIAAALAVKMPSVTSALRKLSELGMINYDPYQYITLTAEGEVHAQQTLQKHETLSEFFHKIVKLEQPRAAELACTLEHHMDMEDLEKFAQVLKDQSKS
ncbi:metal-dependent transcriptional regulator [Desulfurispira natronophila]|uniref:Transcriptional regulator MntR n=1 Tax=Desulfurispira natronophila TaxID=682562 RepID=A0A7W7Y3Q7_9BACT|nr:metal-dependent transcriptional regulator [Desulfurispira natronophila]MBB5021252.1 DtxR family Mn-dependent transcriptional regulator [Desulfurispira natronophila]